MPDKKFTTLTYVHWFRVSLAGLPVCLQSLSQQVKVAIILGLKIEKNAQTKVKEFVLYLEIISATKVEQYL